MKKRLISLILAMLMVLSICPVVMAADSNASAYDVHIKGNLYDGETLTAHYTPYSSDGCDIDETRTKYTWYHRTINISNFAITVTKFAEKTGDNTCVIPSEICEIGYMNAMKNIFVTVTTADANGNYGDPVLSGFYSYPVTDGTSAYAKKNKASFAHLVPKNPEGTVLVGDTLVARYSYLSVNKVAEGATQFTWYRKNTPDGEATQIQSGTSAEYTLTKADIGKWIECTVTPYDVNGTEYDSSTAKLHYGNLGLLNGVTSSFTFFTESKCAETSLVYPMHKLLSDGGALTVNTHTNGTASWTPHSGTFVSHATYQTPGEIKYDLGEVMPLDGVFFDIRSLGATGNAITSYSISYSENGTTWHDIYSTTAATVGAFEFSLPKTVNAQYVKFYTEGKHYKAIINDFYPIQKQDAQVTLPESVGTVSNGVIKVKEFNKSSTALLSDITATSRIDDSALTPVYVDAEGTEINEEFNITANTTAKLKVTGKNGVALEYGLTFNKVEENLTVNPTAGIAYLENNKVMVDNWGTSSADLIQAVSAISAVDGRTLTPTIVDAQGNAVAPFDIDETTAGKYLRFTNTYGDNYDYEIGYKHIKEDTRVFTDTNKYILGTVDFTKYNTTKKNASGEDEAVSGGKYILKTEVYVPDGYTVKLSARQGNTNSNGWFTDMFAFDDATDTVKLTNEDTGFKFIPGRTYTVEYLIDFDSLTIAHIYQNIYCALWIDGVFVGSGVRSASKTTTPGLLSAYTGITATGTPSEKVAFTNSTFRKVESRDTNVVKTNNYALNLKSGDTVVTDIVPGESYAFENTMGVYKGASFTNYLAVFDVTYQDGVEVFRVLNRVEKNPEKIEINAGQEVRAFCFSDTLLPLTNMGEWK